MVVFAEMLSIKIWQEFLRGRGFGTGSDLQTRSDYTGTGPFAPPPTKTNPPPLTPPPLPPTMGLLPLLHWAITVSNTKLSAISISWPPQKYSSPIPPSRRSLGMFSLSVFCSGISSSSLFAMKFFLSVAQLLFMITELIVSLCSMNSRLDFHLVQLFFVCLPSLGKSVHLISKRFLSFMLPV